MTKKVYIAYTGGTIGMQRVNGRYQPIPNFLQQLMAANPAFQHPDLPSYTINQYDPLLDSPNMTPGDWSRIATDICDHYDEYDGFHCAARHRHDGLHCLCPGLYAGWVGQAGHLHRLPNPPVRNPQ